MDLPWANDSIIDRDPAINQALNEIYRDYGDVCSVDRKRKQLGKFGRNLVVGTSFETVAVFQGTVANETFVSTNLIDSISSSDQTNDVGITITIEGQTLDTAGNMTFVSQNATLNGTDARTKVTLTTPLARVTRAYVANSGTFNSPQAVPTGTIYIYDDTDGQTNGVPTTAAATKLVISAGATQSEKCATAISKDDYWIITNVEAGIGDGTANATEVTIQMERRDVKNGGVWRPMGREIVLVVGTANPPSFPFNPYRIVPKNHDWRVRAKCDANTAPVFAEVDGVLAQIIEQS